MKINLSWLTWFQNNLTLVVSWWYICNPIYKGLMMLLVVTTGHRKLSGTLCNGSWVILILGVPNFIVRGWLTEWILEKLFEAFNLQDCQSPGTWRDAGFTEHVSKEVFCEQQLAAYRAPRIYRIFSENWKLRGWGLWCTVHPLPYNNEWDSWQGFLEQFNGIPCHLLRTDRSEKWFAVLNVLSSK